MQNNLKPEVMWFIASDMGLYIGGEFTRKEAIRKFIIEWGGESWAECRRHGNYVVKCLVTPMGTMTRRTK